LQRPCGGCADGHDAATGLPRSIDSFGSLRRDVVILTLDPVLFDAFDTHRLKSCIADVMRNFSDGDAARTQFVEDARGEMQTGGRRGNRSTLPGVDRLILRLIEPLRFIALALDVRRQRRVADLINDLIEVPISLKTNSPPPFIELCDNHAA